MVYIGYLIQHLILCVYNSDNWGGGAHFVFSKNDQ